MSISHEIKERHRAELRAEILLAARDLFKEEGYEGLTLRKLAKRMACSSMALYSYFADKQALLTALAQEAFQSLETRLGSPRAGEPLLALRSMLLEYIAYAEENPVEYRILFLEPQPIQEIKTRQEMRDSDSAFGLLFRCVEACSEAGVFQGDVFTATTILWTGAHGAATVLLTHPDLPFGSRKKFAEEIVETLLSAMVNVGMGEI